jgi:hypothetical protein
LVERVFQTELGEIGFFAEAVKIGMDHVEAGQRIVDAKRKGGARHFQAGVGGDGAEKRPRQGRLAGAEIAGEGDEIARRQHGGDVLGQPLGGGNIFQRADQHTSHR